MVKISKTIVNDFPGNLNLAKPYPAKEQETSAASVDNIVISAERSVDWEYFNSSIAIFIPSNEKPAGIQTTVGSLAVSKGRNAVMSMFKIGNRNK